MVHSIPSIPANKAVLNIHSSTSIVGDSRISPTAVWNALVDTSTWPRWNTFVPLVTMRLQPSSSSTEQQHGTSDDSHGDGNNAGKELSPILQLGTRMVFHVNMEADASSSISPPKNPEKLREVPCVVTVFEPPDPATKKNGRIVWASDNTAHDGFSPWLLRAERTHEIYDEGTEQDQGLRKVQIATYEYQTGLLAYLVRWLHGQRLQTHFDDWVNNLKAFVERELAV